MPPLTPKTYNLKPTLRRFHLLLAAFFVLFGLLSLLPLSFLYSRNLFLGLFGMAPIVSLIFVGFGITLAGSLYLAAQVGLSWPHQRLSQAIAIMYAILAIIGFISGDFWLSLFPNTLASNVLYAIIAYYFLYAGFFHQAATQQPSSLSQAVGSRQVG